MLHGLDDAAAGGEFDGEIPDVEQRLRGHRRLPQAGSSLNPQNNPMHSSERVSQHRLRTIITSSAAGRRCRAGRRRAN
jgi:hypothetical protein